jgi:hypothetical protein
MLEGGITRSDWETNAGTARLLALAQRCGEPLGLQIRGISSGDGSDGNFAAPLGVPTSTALVQWVRT